MDILRAIVSEPERLAIVCLFAVPVIGATLYGSLKLICDHRERIELIRQGIHPDYMDEESVEESKLAMKRASSA